MRHFTEARWPLGTRASRSSLHPCWNPRTSCLLIHTTENSTLISWISQEFHYFHPRSSASFSAPKSSKSWTREYGQVTALNEKSIVIAVWALEDEGMRPFEIINKVERQKTANRIQSSGLKYKNGWLSVYYIVVSFRECGMPQHKSFVGSKSEQSPLENLNLMKPV